jgi:hypothetical protein
MKAQKNKDPKKVGFVQDRITANHCAKTVLKLC